MRKRTISVVMLVTGLLLIPIAVYAAHNFTDVPDSNTFHNDIAWLADAGVTKGCNPPANSDYCPKDNVTREQMAAFMHRLAVNKVVDAATAEHAASADLNVGQVQLLASKHQLTGHEISAFVPTGSSAPCLVTIAETSFAEAGTTLYCGTRTVNGQQGVFLHLYTLSEQSSQAEWWVNVYQDGVDNYGTPVLYTGT